MTDHRYAFRNRDTGEVREAVAYSVNAARRLLGLPVTTVLGPMRHEEQWPEWSCWTVSGQPVWHYTADGCIHDGPRQ